MDLFDKLHVAGTMQHNRKFLFKLLASGFFSAAGLIELGLHLELAFAALVFVPAAGLFFTYLKMEANSKVMRWSAILVVAILFGLLVKSFFLAAAFFVVLDGATNKESVVKYKDVKWVSGSEKEDDANGLAKLLKKHTLFRSLPKGTLKKIQEECVVMDLEEESVLIKEGEFSHYFYLLGKGCVNVLHDGERVATLDAGDIFGEISTVGMSLPVADVVAASNVLAFAFPIEVINAAAEDCPEFSEKLNQVGMRRKAQTDS